MQKGKILIKLKLLPHILPFLAACLSLGLLSFESRAQLPQRPSQRAAAASDTLRPRSDSTVVVPDSLKRKRDIETTVKYTARDSTVLDAITKITYLYGDAQVDYGNISLKADYIELNYLTNITNAKGTLDSTGKLRGTPVFKEGSESYTAEEMRYNFKTKKAIIKGVVTKQGDGNIRGEQVKKDPEDNLYIHNAKYTTCDLKHPHYYINASKIKLVHDKEVVTGPFNLVIADIPTPLGFLFGLFPMTKNKPNGTSGIIVPTYGEEPGTNGRGFFLRNGGYYWAMNQYIGMTFLGEIYSRGGWGASVLSTYKKRYSFDGSFSLRYNKRRVENNDATFTIGQDFWIDWSHRPVPRGVSSFSASVSAGTSKFNSRNAFAYSPNDYLSSAFRSSVSYSTSFRGTPFRTAINLQQDQNVRTGVMNLTLPAVTLNMNRIYPFKTATSTGKGWWETVNVGFDFTGGSFLTNAPTSAGSYPFRLARSVPEGTPTFVNSSNVVRDTVIPFNFSNINALLKRAQVGGSYTVPLSASLKLLRYFSLNPSVSLQGYVYPQRLNFTNTLDGVRVDTIRQFSHAYNFSTSVGFTTRIYGTFNLKGKRIQAIRHTIIPSVSLGYSPDFSDPSFGFYQTVRTSASVEQRYSRYQGFRNGGPSTGRAGSVGFSVNNTLEAKVRAKNDSTGKKFEKVSLLNALNLSGSYNLLADSLKLSNINLSANTRFLKTIDVSMSSTFDPYTYIPAPGSTSTTVGPGIKTNRYLWHTQQKLANLSNANIAIGTSFTPGGNKKNDKARTDRVNNADAPPEDKQKILDNPNLYVDFNVPWSLQVSYSFNYSKQGLSKATYSQTMSFSGDVSLTPKWKVGFNSGYDFVNKGISYTTINIHRDLHCWEMSFNWTPFGGRQYYSFTINVKSAILKDLKLNRQRSFYDQGFDLRR